MFAPILFTVTYLWTDLTFAPIHCYVACLWTDLAFAPIHCYVLVNRLELSWVCSYSLCCTCEPTRVILRLLLFTVLYLWTDLSFTPIHCYAYTLRMWLCMKWHGAWLYGIHRTCRDGSSLLWHQPCQRCKYTTLVDIFKKRAIKSYASSSSVNDHQPQSWPLLSFYGAAQHWYAIVIQAGHVEWHASTVSLLKSGE